MRELPCLYTLKMLAPDGFQSTTPARPASQVSVSHSILIHTSILIKRCAYVQLSSMIHLWVFSLASILTDICGLMLFYRGWAIAMTEFP